MTFTHCFDYPSPVPRAIKKIRVTKCNVARAHCHLLVNISKDYVGTDYKESTPIGWHNGTMAA
jgi:hypothetical protein